MPDRPDHRGANLFELSPNQWPISGPTAGLALVFLLALVFPLAGQWAIHEVTDPATWGNQELHSLLEGFGGFISLGLAGLLALRAGTEAGSGQLWRWVAFGLATMGLFDALHATVQPGQSFVWLHTLASVSGGLFFALGFLPEPLLRRPLWRKLPYLLQGAFLLYAAWLFVAPSAAPTMVLGSEFTAIALGANLTAGVLFWGAALGFARHFLSQPSWESLLFGMLAGFLGTSGFIFGESSLWDPTWWWWHALRLAAFSLAFVYILATFYRWQRKIQELNSRLDEANSNLEQRLAELRESERRFRHLYNQTPVMLHSLDRSGTIQEVSDFWLEHMGYNRSEVIGTPLTAFVHPDYQPVLETALADFFRTGNLRDLEVALVTQKGQIINGLISAAPETDPDDGIRRSVMVTKDITTRKKREAEIEQLAFYDALTGLPNRRLLSERASHDLALAQRHEQPLAVMYTDLDRFKDINDTCGHEAGDQLLVAISERLSKTLRESDTLARVGGDEFVFILPDTDTEEAQKVASRVAEALTPPFFTQGYQFKTSVSIGITQFPEDGADLNELLKNADIAMFQAKDSGQDYQLFHQEQQRSVQLRVHREGELRKAIQGQQLAVQFQPQVRLDERRVFGGEALVRWPHPDWGPVSPEEFIPLAEQTGLIHPLGQLVLDEALERLRTWLNRYDSALRVAVNLSAHELQNPSLPEQIEAALKRHRISGDHLEVEVTETAAMANPQTSLECLEKLRGLGAYVAIDDFGTGYSSFAYLERLPVDSLKIDRSFVAGITANPEDNGIIQTILTLADKLDLDCIAEGVETPLQEQVLRALGCTLAQGFLFSPGLAPEDFEQMLTHPSPIAAGFQP